MKKRAALAATVGLLLGVFMGRYGLQRPISQTPGTAESPAAAQVWTCSMHPQIRLAQAGNCPICEMPLIPASSAQSGAGGVPQLQLSEHALAMAHVETTPVARRELSRELRAVGKIQYNESALATITARVDGYAERLFVDFTGVEIKAGDHLVEVYSPELLVAQQELLIALQSGTGGHPSPLVEMSKLKLRRWGLTDAQITELAEHKKIAERVTLYSPIQGTVIEKNIVQNSAFKAGDALYRVANLDTVWVYLDIYEVDLAWVRYGQRVDLTAEALPGRTFEGRVTFVQPIVNEETRTIRVPVHIENSDHTLKPGMFVSAVIRSVLTADGTAAATGVEGKFSCPMHPQVLKENAGACPLCEMPLAQIPGATPVTAQTGTPGVVRYACPMACEGAKRYDRPGACPVCNMKLKPLPPTGPAGKAPLAVPVSAVLDSGTRRIVYVDKGQGLFEPRDVVLGPRTGEFFLVLKGLAEGDRVVTRGGFLIDSQFQVTGHPSLFYPGGLMGGSCAHAHDETHPDDGDAAPPPASEPPVAPARHTH
ncbi:MAG TPA: efflux RND transporter periplasmic adaptor subunit [Kiritimatiellia bacterium]|nr:efflux RND transporter periplasmic adaptor subunit [Kiritimatiellia bacterium]HRU69613.1 efflux RND transporter periplasmic adaptor subunit [Kiritimatiellia bacterium]